MQRDEELASVLTLDVDARYAYAIDAIRENGELWTLADEDGWVVSNSSGASVPVWPHERFAALEATGAWADAKPVRVSLEHDWLTEARASWFEDNEVRVAVFVVGTSSMTADYSAFAQLLRGEQPARYVRSSGVARKPKRATRVTKDLVAYINGQEIDLVVERVPREYRVRLRDVFRVRSSDAKILGGVSTRGRRDIDLTAALPVRVSLRRYLHGGQSPDEFGAPKRGQWPPWAVRRFLLYDVLFHEIGHLQIVDPAASRVTRKFASETRAQEFADELRRTLYSEHFEHLDPIHNAPEPVELELLDVWARLDKERRALLVKHVLSPRQLDNAAMAVFEPMTKEQRQFLVVLLNARRPRRAIRPTAS
jgi:hypothetical protein